MSRPYRVTVEPPAGASAPSCRRRCRRKQPEIDDRVQGPRKKVATSDIDRVGPAKRRGNDLKQQLDRHTRGGPQPHDRIGDRAEHRRGTGCPRLARFHRAIAPIMIAHQIHDQLRPAPDRCRRTGWRSAAGRRCKVPASPARIVSCRHPAPIAPIRNPAQAHLIPGISARGQSRRRSSRTP